jgi:hypothetical protein
MKKYWKFSDHFFDRFIERFDADKNRIRKISSYFNDHCLVEVYKCHVNGFKQRVTIDGMKVCYIWNDVAKQIIVTTVY